MPRRRRRRGSQGAQTDPPPPPDLADLLPPEREVFDRAVNRLVLSGCPADFAVVLVWNRGAWLEWATAVLDAAVVDVDPQRKHVRLVPRPPI